MHPSRLVLRRSVALAAALVVGAASAAWATSAVASSANHGRPAPGRQVVSPSRPVPARPATAHIVPAGLRPDSVAPHRAGPLTAPAVQPDATVPRTWQGINDSGSWPTAPTSAIGPTRYVEAVNSVTGEGYAVYDRQHDQALAKGPLYELTSCADANCFNTFVSVIWDPTTKRFYYSAEELPPGPGQTGHVMFGFSKTSTPSDSNSWCHYQFGVGANLPDRPQLGDSRDFVVIGDNLYDGVSEKFLGARLLAFSKPGSGSISSCPSTVEGGSSSRLENSAGHDVFAPAPANETDSDGSGWALARTNTLPSKTLALFQVTRGSTGSPVFHTKGVSIPVASYKGASDAAQKGVAYKVDTGFAGVVHPVAAIDPMRGNKDRIWSTQTVGGAAGSVVRWYEIDPVGHKTVQSGTISFPALWAFNGAISPDRVVDGATHAFGSSMAVSFDTSSKSTLPTAYVKTKVRGGAISAATKVATSGAADTGADCRQSGDPCAWGGGSATPDPAAPTSGTTGNVWVAQMLAGRGADQFTSSGISWNFETRL